MVLSNQLIGLSSPALERHSKDTRGTGAPLPLLGCDMSIAIEEPEVDAEDSWHAIFEPTHALQTLSHSADGRRSE